jgi:hypothetical protein
MSSELPNWVEIATLIVVVVSLIWTIWTHLHQPVPEAVCRIERDGTVDDPNLFSVVIQPIPGHEAHVEKTVGHGVLLAKRSERQPVPRAERTFTKEVLGGSVLLANAAGWGRMQFYASPDPSWRRGWLWLRFQKSSSISVLIRVTSPRTARIKSRLSVTLIAPKAVQT